MIKNIIREVAPEACDFSLYFDCDGLSGHGDEYYNNLFIVSRDRWGRIDGGINTEEYERVQREAENIIDSFERVGGGMYDFISYKEAMEYVGVPYNSRKCHALKEWAKTADAYEAEAVAEYLTITTGKKWAVSSAHGYCQGDYVEMVYCPERYPDGVKNYGEIWLGCGKEFCVIDVEDYQEPEEEGGEPTYTEGDTVYGYIVADSEAWRDEDYKRIVCEWAGINEAETRLEMIDGQNTYTTYSYRVA